MQSAERACSGNSGTVMRLKKRVVGYIALDKIYISTFIVYLLSLLFSIHTLALRGERKICSINKRKHTLFLSHKLYSRRI